MELRFINVLILYFNRLHLIQSHCTT
jgi:hypothetical protein